MDNKAQPRLYNIKDNDYYFHAGYLQNGHPVLMGVQLPELVLVEFDTDGTYLYTRARNIRREPYLVPEVPTPYTADEQAFSMALWQDEIGFTPGTIAVKPFFLTERWIGIKDLPDHYQEMLDHLESVIAERREYLQEDIRLWQERGDFVLFWDDEYYMSRDGDVDSS